MISRSFVRIVILIIPILILYGCGSGPAQTQTESLPPTAVPTEVAPPTSSGPESVSIAALTANETNITVSTGESSGEEINKFETISLPEGEQITSDKSGRAVMRFGDRHEVELFGATQVRLDEAKLESGGSISLRLKQVAGHTRVFLNEGSIARVTLETDDSTITTLEQGTEFIVCFAPGKITCVEVQKGEVEVTSLGKKVTLREGQATYYAPGQPPPDDEICARSEEVEDWLIQKRGPGEVQTLGQLVQSWPQEPCPAGAPEPTAAEVTPGVPTATLPPTETPAPTLVPTATVPPGKLYVRINEISIDDQGRYVVAYETFEYTEQLPGMHVHFFFDTVPPEQAGVPGSGPWILYGGPRPFTGYRVSDRPSAASQMCALVANADHSIQLNSGNCVDLP
jgi:hypothetical protein